MSTEKTRTQTAFTSIIACPISLKRPSAYGSERSAFEELSPRPKALRRSRSSSPNPSQGEVSNSLGSAGRDLWTKPGAASAAVRGKDEDWDIFWMGAIPILRSKTGEERDIEIFPHDDVSNGWLSHIWC